MRSGASLAVISAEESWAVEKELSSQSIDFSVVGDDVLAYVDSGGKKLIFVAL